MLILIPSINSVANMYLAKRIFRYIFLILMTCGCASQALSINKSIATESGIKSNLLQSYVWYDGHKKKTVWLNPGLMAEFRSTSVENNILQKQYPTASIIQVNPSIRIWQHKTQPLSAALLNHSKSSRQSTSKYSPVFHDAPNELSSMRSLPGNVIVYFNPSWDQSKIMSWLETHGFHITKKLAVRSNAYLLKTEPGIETLELANALYESGEVLAAFPDWWLEGTTR